MQRTLPFLDIAFSARERTAIRAHRARRVLNVAVAAVGIVLTLPLMALIAIAVRLTSRGPVIYRQPRVGVDRRALTYARGNTRRHFDVGGKLFTIYKFRTMYVDASNGREQWAQEGDRRITPVGRWLRCLRLDELPQLFNVLKGDMNVVGPRPEQPTLFVELRELIEGYQRRQRVLPGITGLAQVTYSYDSSVDDVRRKLRVDLDYIRNESVLQDVSIMARTIPVMLGMRGGW